MRLSLLAITFVILLADSSWILAADARPPNILIIVTDDQGYADLSAFDHHAADIHTPGMDRIAREGVLFTQAYVSAPVCSPSRAGWNTGRYQERWDPEAGWRTGLPASVRTLAEYFKAAGYVTGKIGKNDYGKGYHSLEPREYPLNHGYDEFLGFCSHAHDYFLLSEEIEKQTPDPRGNSAALGRLFHNRSRKSYERGYTTEIFTDAAIDFVTRHQTRPFLLTLSYNSLHHLIHEVPERYLNKQGVKPVPLYDLKTMGTYKQYYDTYATLETIDGDNMRKYYLANLNCLDDQIGRLLGTLDQIGLSEKTLVIFFSDNGGSPLTGANNLPLRGAKYVLYEGGVRVPFAMRWPAKLPKGEMCEDPVFSLDILPTCLRAANIPIRDNMELDGMSILEAAAAGAPVTKEERSFFWKWRDQFAVRRGDWKLIKSNDSHSATSLRQSDHILHGPESAGMPQLFNLKQDPSEQQDMSNQNPGKVTELKGIYDAWESRLGN